jgi:hypothetical protein
VRFQQRRISNVQTLTFLPLTSGPVRSTGYHTSAGGGGEVAVKMPRPVCKCVRDDALNIAATRSKYETGTDTLLKAAISGPLVAGKLAPPLRPKTRGLIQLSFPHILLQIKSKYFIKF